MPVPHQPLRARAAAAWPCRPSSRASSAESSMRSFRSASVCAERSAPSARSHVRMRCTRARRRAGGPSAAAATATAAAHEEGEDGEAARVPRGAARREDVVGPRAVVPEDLGAVHADEHGAVVLDAAPHGVRVGHLRGRRGAGRRRRRGKRGGGGSSSSSRARAPSDLPHGAPPPIPSPPGPPPPSPAHLDLEVLGRERVRDCNGRVEVRAHHGEALRARGGGHAYVRACRSRRGGRPRAPWRR